MGQRRIRREQRQVDQKTSRRVNGKLKVKERRRRDDRMLKIVKEGKWQFLPAVRSWLSAQLNKPSNKITQEEVNRLVNK